MSHYHPFLATILATSKGLKIVGIILALIGIVMRYLIGRNRFNRRTITGVETFSSYERMNLTRFGEWLASIIGMLLIIGGVFLFVLSLFHGHAVHQK